MSADWKPGDLALCVSKGPDPDDWDENGGGPRVGQIYCVIDLELVAPGGWYEAGVWLRFPEWPGDTFYHRGFQKVTPLSPDAEDAETIRLLNGLPVREPVA